MNNRSNRHTSERGRIFDSRITRVLSVRCNDVDLALCSMMLEKLGVQPVTITDVVKKVLLMVALQAEEQCDEVLTTTEARSYLSERFGDVGVSRNRQAYNDIANAEHARLRGGPEFRMNLPMGYAANTVTENEETVTPSSGLTGAEETQYMQHVIANKLNIATFTPVDWKNAKQAEIQRATQEAMKRYNIGQETIPTGCDVSLPIAINDTPEELDERVLERQQREQLERDEMQRATLELAQQLNEGNEDGNE